MKTEKTPFDKGIHAFWSKMQLHTGVPAKTRKPKRQPRAKQNSQTTDEELRELLECSRTFEQWLVVIDDVSRHADIRSAARAQARKQAVLPVHLIELYFRATPQMESRLVRQIKAVKAPRAEWVKVLFVASPCKLTEFIIEYRIGRAYLEKLCATALNGEKVHFAEHLRISPKHFGART